MYKIVTFCSILYMILHFPLLQKNDFLSSKPYSEDRCAVNTTSGMMSEDHRTMMVRSLAGLFFTQCLSPVGLDAYTRMIVSCLLFVNHNAP